MRLEPKKILFFAHWEKYASKEAKNVAKKKLLDSG